MSEKLTRIRLRGTHYGLQDWGEHTFEEMAEMFRERARRLKDEAEAILVASDTDFDVAIVRGPLMQHFIRKVEPKT